jgi:hypothetical protein
MFCLPVPAPIHISVRDLYISRIGLPILLQGNMWTDPRNMYLDHRQMNEEIGAEAEEYINGVFLTEWSKMHLELMHSF